MRQRCLGTQLLLFVVSVTGGVAVQRVAWAQCPFVSGSTGADGPLSPSANTTLPLPASGVFNFTTVNIPAGVTVKFQKNATNTPVVILATGNVTISGTIDVQGSVPSGAFAGAGGPGGYDGGMGGTTCAGAGLGPGGGGAGCGNTVGASGGGGGFATAGTNGSTSGVGGSTYGNDSLVPLIGGSGGGGANSVSVFGVAGGGGGGAILIASSSTITVNGGSNTVNANGGGGAQVSQISGAGSGGSIRLIGSLIAGSGTMLVNGGVPGITAGKGRIRFEACQSTYSGSLPPTTAFGTPAPAFVAGVPTLAITSVGGVVAPASPSGSFASPDISLPSSTTTATVQLAGNGIPLGTTVAVKVTPNKGAAATTISSPMSGTESSSTGSADVTLSTGVTVISAATTIMVAQAGSSPILVGSVDGERIEKIRIAAVFGGASSLTYITESGREIPARGLTGSAPGHPAG